MRGERAVFLDRDGVIAVPEFREGRSFAVRRFADFRLYDGIESSLAELRAAGYQLIVVTNQPDVGKGLMSEETLERMHDEMRSRLPIDDIWTCRHTREDNCTCRKPKAGMLMAAAAAHGIDLERSFMVGDRGSDIEAGRAAGCRTIFIDLQYEAEPAPTSQDWTVRDLQEASAVICRVTVEEER